MNHFVPTHRESSRMIVLFRSRFFLCAMFVALVASSFANNKTLAQQPEAVQPPPQPAAVSPAVANQVVATVDGQPIALKDVAQVIQAITRGRPVPDQAKAEIMAEALEQLIRRRLVQLYVEAEGQMVDPAAVDAEIKKQKERLAAQQIDLAKALQQQGLTEDDMRRDLGWQLSWKQYVDKNVTDKQLQDYFKAHQTEFDGSQVEASHILLQPTRMDDPKELAATVERAKALRAELVAETIAFDEAAKKHSDGPSGKDGGKLGYFARKGMMVEPFARAAFALKKGEVSQPVLTQFGVHLIKATNIKPGARPWTESRPQLTAAAAGQMFQDLATSQRKKSPVEYTGAAPYRDPATKKIVLPKKP